MPDEPPVSVVNGPKGEAKIYEVWADGRLIEYQVHVGSQVHTCTNLGEAYILAGDEVGTPT